MRERMVTRTINETTAKALIYENESGNVETREFKLTSVTDSKVALKQLKKLYENDNITIVRVLSIDVKEVLYGMSEIDFIAHAQKMENYFTKA